MAAVTDTSNSNALNDAELVFLAAVFAYMGIHGHPTKDEFRQGLEIMSAYAKQVQDNPPEDGSEGAHTLGNYHLSDDERLKMAAVAFMRFGVTKPTSWQWQAAHEQLFAPVLSPTANCQESEVGPIHELRGQVARRSSGLLDFRTMEGLGPHLE